MSAIMRSPWRFDQSGRCLQQMEIFYKLLFVHIPSRGNCLSSLIVLSSNQITICKINDME